MAEILIETYSDHDMQCPAAWQNGYKDAVIESWGEAERTLSHPRTGDPTSSTFTFRRSDTDRRIREDLASPTRRYFPTPLQVNMTTIENRAVLGDPWTVFVGLITALNLEHPLHVDVTLGDVLTAYLLSDQDQSPWRIIGEGFLDQLSTVSPHLDLQQPEPIVYGRHVRTIVDAASAQGFCLEPPYLGEMTIGGTVYHVWLVAGHAVKAIPTIRVDDVEKIADEGSQWFVPHHAGHDGLFDGNPYNDFRSSAYGNDRRYTLIFGVKTNLAAAIDALTDPDACALGLKTLTVAVYGIETAGDGRGAEITDRLLAYAHYMINFGVRRGIDGYQSGPWLSNPEHELFGETVPIVKESTFGVASAIAAERLPQLGSPGDDAGYLVAAVIGARPGDRQSKRRYVAEWNRSCSVRSGWTHLGEFAVYMLHPTQAAKDAARLITDATEILEGGYTTELAYDLHATRIPFRTDYKHATGIWFTVGVYSEDAESVNYNQTIESEPLEFTFAPGITAAYHLARMEGIASKHPPRLVRLQETIGPHPGDDSLGYLELGQYAKFRCFDAVSNAASEVRLGWCIAHAINVQTRVVRVTLLDVDDLIDFDLPTDAPAFGSPAERNETCATAIDMGDLSSPFSTVIDTTEHATDPAVPGSPSFGGSGVAYHAAWFKMTGNIFDGVATFSALGSAYDTQMAVFGGACGSLFPIDFNDNFGGGNTSLLDVAIVGGTDYFIMIAGYGPADGGPLHFSAVFTPNP